MRAEDEEQSRPEVDRGVLRDLLLGSLRPDTVLWGQQLISVNRGGDERLSLVFAAQTVEADLVIGGDGGWSKVRPLVSDVTRPTYSGAIFVQTLIRDADTRHPRIASLVWSRKYSGS